MEKAKKMWVEWKPHTHPLMDKMIAVPLQFDIGEGVRGIVITGPNTGGKTVSLKTKRGKENE